MEIIRKKDFQKTLDYLNTEIRNTNWKIAGMSIIFLAVMFAVQKTSDSLEINDVTIRFLLKLIISGKSLYDAIDYIRDNIENKKDKRRLLKVMDYHSNKR